MKTELFDRPSPAPLLPPAPFALSEPQLSDTTTHSSTSSATPPLSVPLPAASVTAIHSPLQIEPGAPEHTQQVDVMCATPQDTQSSSASSRLTSVVADSEQPTCTATTQSTAAVPSYSIQLVLPATLPHIAPTLPYAPTSCPAPFPPSHHTASASSIADCGHFASHPVPSPSTSATSSTTTRTHSHSASFTSPAAMEQLLMFLLDEVSDLKRTIRTMQDEREAERREKREKHKRRQQAEKEEARQRDERKEAETEAVAIDTEDARGERSDDTPARVADGKQREKRKKKKKKKNQEKRDEQPSETEKEKRKKKRKRAEKGAEADEPQDGSRQAENDTEERERGELSRKKKRKAMSVDQDLSATDEVVEPPTELPKDKEARRKRKEKAHLADSSDTASNVAAAASSSSSSWSASSAFLSRPAASPPPTSASQPSTSSSPILRIGFSPALFSTSSVPPSGPATVDRSLSRREPSTHTTFLPAPISTPLPPAHPTATLPATLSPSTPSVSTDTSTSSSANTSPLLIPAAMSLVSVDQNGSVRQWQHSDADVDLDDMPSLERVDSNHAMDKFVTPVQSPAIRPMRLEDSAIDLSDEQPPLQAESNSTPTAISSTAASAALPDHSPHLLTVSLSTSPASSSSSSLSSSSQPGAFSVSDSTSTLLSAAPTLLQQEVKIKKAKLALLAAQQKAAKLRAEEEAAERKRLAEQAAAKWAADEQKKREVAWLRREIARKEEDKTHRDRQHQQQQRERDKRRPPQQPQQHSKSGRVPHVPAVPQQQRTRPTETRWSVDGSGVAGGQSRGEQRSGADHPSEAWNPPMAWFEDRRGEQG